MNHSIKTVLCVANYILTLQAISLYAAENNHIRTLAASCAICHSTATTGSSVIPGLSGLDESYFVSKMQEFQNSSEEHDVMVQHAKGLNLEEINSLAKYFAGQSRSCPRAHKTGSNHLWSK